MKYINLLPPKLQLKTTVNRRESKISSKSVIGCLVIPGLLFVVFFGGMKLVEYRYNQKLEIENTPSPVINQSQFQVVPSKVVIQPLPPPKKESPPIPEKGTSSAIVTPEARSSKSSKQDIKKSGYTLGLGSFPTKDEAEALMQKIREQKLEPYQQLKQITRRVNTVYVDQSPTMEEAMIMTQQLEADGFESFVKIRSQGAYWVGVNSFPSRAKAQAQELAERLLSLGYSAKVVAEKQPLTIYQVYLGHYKKYRAAKLMQNKLEEQGYHSTSIIME